MTVPTLRTERLTLRPWTIDDASTALAVYGEAEVSRWLSPAMGQVHDKDAMMLLLQQWINEQERLLEPQGRWAVELSETGELVGGVGLLYLPPGVEDLELAWQLAPTAWGNGYATEAGLAVARY